MKKLFLILLIAIALLFLSGQDQTKQGTVVRVIDGDTLELATGEKVRLLGINAPEMNEGNYELARKSLAKAVEGKDVSFESKDKDRYGRVLAWVYLEDLSVNLGMIQSGLAHAYFPEYSRYEQVFREAEEQAREKGLGIWERSSVWCVSVKIKWDEGIEKDTDQEWIVVRNGCKNALDLHGWSLKDEATHIYRFEDVELNPGERLKLVTGTGTNQSVLYWERKSPVWNNDGDRLFLRDDRGLLVLIEGY